MNKNRINTMFLHYADVKKSVITMPHTESFEVELCKTGYDIYRLNVNNEPWSEDVPRPENHFILSHGDIPSYINYNLFLVPCHKYDENIVKNVSEILNIPTIQVDDIQAIPPGRPCPFGWAKNIDESSKDFVSYWKETLEKHARYV